VPPNTGWHEAFLAHVAAGDTFRQAASKVGVSDVTVHNHLRRFPDLRTAATAARTKGGTVAIKARPADIAWHRAFIALIEDGWSISAAARLLKLSPGKIYWQAESYPQLRAALNTAAARAHRKANR
jgi:lambda repressor-like predicted transcriptional regulator